MWKTCVFTIWIIAALSSASSLNMTTLNNAIETNLADVILANRGENFNATEQQNNRSTTEKDHAEDIELNSAEPTETIGNKGSDGQQYLTTENQIATEPKFPSTISSISEQVTDYSKSTVIIQYDTTASNDEDDIYEQNETVSIREPEYSLSTISDDSTAVQRSAEILADSIVIDTTSGQIKGHQWRDKEILSYIDIPYGTFSGLFEAPQPAVRSDTIHEVSEHAKRCPQLQNDLHVGDEDCLTLSIFTPYNADKSNVLFHIHGGNLMSGSGDPAIYGPEYLVSKGLILVLPNYRLGPLGFLCMQNDEIPGNAALKDLTLALNWTKENIEAFGGNASNIIVSGDGASGAIAGYLALSPKSKHYMNKVIMESGAVLSHLSFDRNPMKTAETLLNKVENGAHNKVNVTKLLIASKDIDFRPCLEKNDDAFMDQTPWEMINDTDPSMTFMIGSAMYAGIYEALVQTEETINQLNNDYTLLLPNDLKFTEDEERNRVGKLIKSQYFGENVIQLTDVKKLTVCFTDAAYLGPGLRAARLLALTGATVYLYEFSFVGEFNRELDSMARPVDGAVKGDIVGYLFAQDGEVPHENTKEESMVNSLVNLWSTFMDTGSPSTDDVQWTALSGSEESEEEWLSIGTKIEMRAGYHVDRLKLWTEIYNKYFIEHNIGYGLSPRVDTVLIVQLALLIGLKNVLHLS